MTIDRQRIVEGLRAIALEAGRAILDIYAHDITVREKDDRTPVTDADTAAEDIILARLAELTPGIPIIAEEQVAAGKVPEIAERFWLVDPLDGTKEFISRNGEFTVNVALIEAHRPTLGVVYAPAKGRLFLAGPAGASAAAQAPSGTWSAPHSIGVRAAPADGLTVVASRSHRDEKTDKYLEQFNVHSVISAGSSLKFCLVAAGEADLYPRLGRTMEWDTAAGHAVLAAAGGRVETLDGASLTYGKAPIFENPFFVARGEV